MTDITVIYSLHRTVEPQPDGQMLRIRQLPVSAGTEVDKIPSEPVRALGTDAVTSPLFFGEAASQGDEPDISLRVGRRHRFHRLLGGALQMKGSCFLPGQPGQVTIQAR